jgi:hypothetical protein
VSRAGVRARRARLTAAGQWTNCPAWSPSSVLKKPERPPAVTEAQQRLERALAAREVFLRVSGTLGWQRARTERRAASVARLRARRLAGYKNELHKTGGM